MIFMIAQIVSDKNQCHHKNQFKSVIKICDYL